MEFELSLGNPRGEGFWLTLSKEELVVCYAPQARNAGDFRLLAEKFSARVRTTLDGVVEAAMGAHDVSVIKLEPLELREAMAVLDKLAEEFSAELEE